MQDKSLYKQQLNEAAEEDADTKKCFKPFQVQIGRVNSDHRSVLKVYGINPVLAG